MPNWRTMLQSNGIQETVLDADTQAWIKEYCKLEKSRIPAVYDKEKEEFTPTATAKLNRINKAIIDGISDYMVEQEEAEEAARLKKKEEDEKNNPPPPPPPPDPVPDPPKKQGLFDWMFD